MAKQFKKWKDQGPLKRGIRDSIDKGIGRDDLIRDFDTQDVTAAIDELVADWLIFECDGMLMVSEWSHSSLIKATGQGDYSGALMFLLQKGVWHPDMDRFGITENGVNVAEEAENAQHEAAEKMITMPESDKVTKVDGAQGEDVTYREVPSGSNQITSAVDIVAHETFKDEKHEFTIQEIRSGTLLLDDSEMAVELGGWMLSNVEQFIDNHETVFRMYLNIKSDMGMPVSSLFQRYYLSVPDVDEGKGITNTLVDSMYEALDAKLASAKAILDSDAEFQEGLFKRMSYFYEMTGFVVKDGQVQQAIKQSMQGKVRINELVFDPISLTTTVSQGVGKHEDGKVREGDKKVIVKREEMPAGFGIEIELSLSHKNATPLAMY